MKITILTLFPEMFGPVTTQSLLGRANEKKILEVSTVNIRDYTLDKHNRTDDTPFGGGAGMVLSAEPVFRALEACGYSPKEGGAQIAESGAAEGAASEFAAAPRKVRFLYPSPRGRMLDQNLVEELAREEELVILCGHYEGVDQRILDAWEMEEVSVGDYILTGGELPAMVIIDAVARFVPEVLGSADSHREESIYSGLLEYPQYTKPRNFRGLTVPEVLVSGDHAKIHLWQLEQSLRLTKERRPDLFRGYLKRKDSLPKVERKLIDRVQAEETVQGETSSEDE